MTALACVRVLSLILSIYFVVICLLLLLGCSCEPIFSSPWTPDRPLLPHPFSGFLPSTIVTVLY